MICVEALGLKPKLAGLLGAGERVRGAQDLLRHVRNLTTESRRLLSYCVFAAQAVERTSEAIRVPNVIRWFGCGGHEPRGAAGEMGRLVRSRRLRRWLVPSVPGLLEAREKEVREEVTRSRAALGEAETALQ